MEIEFHFLYIFRKIINKVLENEKIIPGNK